MIRNAYILTSAVCFAVATSLAYADSANIGASKDNTLYGDENGDLSNGVGEHFFVGRTDQDGDPERLRRAVIAFDIAGSIPAGSTIDSVILTLNMSRAKNNSPLSTIGLHRLQVDWGEGASDAPSNEGAGTSAATGDATWIHTFYSTQFWSNPGADGDYTAGASASTVIDQEDPYSWGSTPGMVADVQAWLDTPAANFGWLLKGNESQNRSAKRFDSRENAEPADRPVLTVNFTPPAGTGACCFANGDCQVLTMAACGTAGGSYQGDGAPCVPNNCPQPTGACCFLDGSCQVLEETDCGLAGGSYQGDDVPCNPCAALVGACCFSGAQCTVLSPGDCDSQGGDYLGDGTDCDPNPCPLNLEPYVDELPIPAVASPVGTTPEGYPQYVITMTQFEQKLHRDMASTTVWGYEGATPGPIIVAQRDQPIEVTWVNDLRDESGMPRTDHYLDVDLCTHGAANEPKTVVHLHGGHVPADVDGYPEETFLPGNPLTNHATYVYPNEQAEALIWFHDHALGITRLNVYMGLAGAYVIDDPDVNPNLPAGIFDVPLVIQDRVFEQDGELYYPPTWQEHFFGEYVMVNAKVWPYLNVKKGKYRFRTLNGSNSRTYVLTLDDGSGTPPTFWQITTDGGYLPAPVPLTELTMGPGERAEIVVDFEPYGNNDEIFLVNSAPAPFPGDPGVGVIPQVMKFITESGGQPFTDPLPATLEPVPPLDEADTKRTRTLELSKEPDPAAEGCGSIWLINGLHWDDITEYAGLGTTELWEFVNPSGVMHPMHLHLDFFQILNRQAFDVIDGEIVPVGPTIPPAPNEAGWKDTARVNPGEILRVIAQFKDYEGKFPYHCHILEHEDHEMMRQFQVVICPADVNGDGEVNVVDLVAVILFWDTGNNAADTNDDGIVNVLDLLDVILGWGPCLP